jgi:hypothetical protein
MLPTYAFFCQCSLGLCFVPNFWISSCVVQWKRCPSFSLLSSSPSPLSCSHRVLLPLFRGFPPLYITEHIQKYCSVKNFIKLPFQRVLIHLNRSPNEGAMAILFPLLHAVQKISERATFGNSAIPACRNLRLTWCLIRWKRNFMGLLVSKDILLFSLEVLQKLIGTKTSCELIRYVDDLDLVVFGALRPVSFGFKSSPLLDQRVAWRQWCVFFIILL